MIPTSLLPHRITIEPYEGESGAAGPVYGTSFQARARVEGRRRAVRSANGTDVISSASAIVRPHVNPRPESKVLHDGRRYEILEVIVGQGLRRPEYRELVLGGPQ